MTSAFFGHGAPTLAVDEVKGRDFRNWASTINERDGVPRGIIVISAHWRQSEITLGSTNAPETIHDFGGFPQALYQLRYSAPGAPDLATRVEEKLKEAGWTVRRDENRGLDHGVWIPLWHMYRDANVPVLQISLLPDAARVFALGEKLAPFMDEQILLAGSGALTHNLGEIGADGSPPPSWAVEFDAWCKEQLVRRDWDSLVDFAARAPHARRAHPTYEHFLPLLFMAGAASAKSVREVRFPVEGFEYGSLSRRSVEY